MDVTMFGASPHDPFKPLDRRWLRAGHLVESGLSPSPHHDDAWVERAVAYRRALAACRDDEDRLRLAERLPAVAEAHRLFTTALPLARAELEARLLAGESDDAIAAKMALTSAGVAAYQATFYCVRPRLRADGYIQGVVLGGTVHSGLAPDDREMLLRVCGYALGPRGVDDALDYLRDPPVMPASFDALDPTALRKLRDRLLVKLHVLTLTTPATAASAATWAWLGERVAADRLGSRGDDGADGDGAIRPALDLAAGLLQRQRGGTEPAGAAEVVVLHPWADRRQHAEAGGVSHSLVAVPA
jgi:hypothetical protein